MQDKQNGSQAMPLVSFIIAYYNLPPAMLCECVDSILNLSLKSSEREIIVIDDGSDKSPLDALAERLDNVVYVRQKNGGLSAARNRGLQIATGQYVQFVDADDYLLQAPYEHCLDMVRYRSSDIVMFDFTNSEEDTLPQDYREEDLATGAEYMSHFNIHATSCCYLFKRAILGTLRFTTGTLHEDEEFTPQLLLRAESVCSTSAQAYFYRQRPHSITSDATPRQTIRRLGDLHKVITKLAIMADRLPTSERTALSRRVAQLTMDYIYNIILQTRSRHYLDRKLSQLKREGLFPLPDRDYTTKYKWFRRMTNNSVGLTLLFHTLPILNKEK